MLHLENIVKRFGDYTALSGITMDVPTGKVFGLLGPNGAGKTTLIRIITRITGPDEGRILFDGRPMVAADVAQMGYLPEERGLYKKMKVGEQAMYLAQLKGMPKAEARKRLTAWFERWEMDGWWNKKVEELSKGMAQKVQFITTVMHEPKLLILDEPFSGFDPINAELIRSEILRLRDEGITIMLSTHGMGSVEELCDNIGLIDRSKLMLEGSVGEIRKRFSTNTYRIDFKGTKVVLANALSFTGELIDATEHGENATARVRLGKGSTVNDVLRQLLPAVEVHGVHEEIPRMHDIFIRVVSERDPSVVTPGMTE
ncbi:MAG: ATP-binding cassette domain-containing protein [Flavobacteriales bacterium]|nr:ATP-binding cassette domain-containing protein [Flavobacteriales bacterium]MBK9536668.1 ATP-binding cassette domain-containing protein [Flavobacteriales bacterium]HQX31859.1 ATP-binding cassette domain-containing protein [Flavobacteriales bacterium]